MVTIQKSTLRKEARRKRNRIKVTQDMAQSAGDLFLKHIKPQQNQIVSAYWPKSSEFDTMPILESLLEQDIQCSLPVTEKGVRIMRFGKWNKNTKMTEATFGIMEPEIKTDNDIVIPDIIISPLLAFDRHGFRLGYGGGNYDATLEQLMKQKKITVVGLAYDEQACNFNLPHEDHDIPCEWIITPTKAYHFKKKDKAK